MVKARTIANIAAQSSTITSLLLCLPHKKHACLSQGELKCELRAEKTAVSQLV
jgi:hypothetical protein